MDMVALSGGHTIGDARCNSLLVRLYNFSNSGAPDPSIDKSLLASLQRKCPQGGDGNVTIYLDMQTPTLFDNYYFQNILASKGLFSTDQVLFTATSDATSLVQQYAYDQNKFFISFAKSMIKMGNLNPLVGKAGQIRKNCRVANPTEIDDEDTVEAEIEAEAEAEAAAAAKANVQEGRDLRHLVERTRTEAIDFATKLMKRVALKFMNEDVEPGSTCPRSSK